MHNLYITHKQMAKCSKTKNWYSLQACGIGSGGHSYC